MDFFKGPFAEKIVKSIIKPQIIQKDPQEILVTQIVELQFKCLKKHGDFHGFVDLLKNGEKTNIHKNHKQSIINLKKMLQCP